MTVAVFGLCTGVALAAEPAKASAADGQAVRKALMAALESAPDTPDHKAYLPLAEADGEQARASLRLALQTPDDAAAMKRNLSAALHAVAPTDGTGMRGAVSRARKGLDSVARSYPDDRRAQEAAAGLAAAEPWLDEAVDLGRAAVASASPAVLLQGTRGMLRDLDRALDGWDRDANGTIEWQRGEAGVKESLAAARRIAETNAAK